MRSVFRRRSRALFLPLWGEELLYVSPRRLNEDPWGVLTLHGEEGNRGGGRDDHRTHRINMPEESVRTQNKGKIRPAEVSKPRCSLFSKAPLPYTIRVDVYFPPPLLYMYTSTMNQHFCFNKLTKKLNLYVTVITLPILIGQKVFLLLYI